MQVLVVVIVFFHTFGFFCGLQIYEGLIRGALDFPGVRSSEGVKLTGVLCAVLGQKPQAGWPTSYDPQAGSQLSVLTSLPLA